MYRAITWRRRLKISTNNSFLLCVPDLIQDECHDGKSIISCHVAYQSVAISCLSSIFLSSFFKSLHGDRSCLSECGEMRLDCSNIFRGIKAHKRLGVSSPSRLLLFKTRLMSLRPHLLPHYKTERILM